MLSSTLTVQPLATIRAPFDDFASRFARDVERSTRGSRDAFARDAARARVAVCRRTSASLHIMARDDDDGDGDAHYAGLFLDADARRKVWALAHRLLGMSCAPPGAKSSADHVTLAHAPDRDTTTRVLELARRRRSRAVTVTMTHACVRPRACMCDVVRHAPPRRPPQRRRAAARDVSNATRRTHPGSPPTLPRTAIKN